jgi:large subunit ribosomal protein L9
VKVVFSKTSQYREDGDIKDVAWLRPQLPAAATPAAAATPSVVTYVPSRRRACRTRATKRRAPSATGRGEDVHDSSAGASGKLGSVGTADIAEHAAALKQEFDRHNVQLADPIKDLGDYQVPVKLTKNVVATLSVTVIGEDGATAADIRAKSQPAETPAAVDDSDADDADQDEESEDDEEYPPAHDVR